MRSVFLHFYHKIVLQFTLHYLWRYKIFFGLWFITCTKTTSSPRGTWISNAFSTCGFWETVFFAQFVWHDSSFHFQAHSVQPNDDEMIEDRNIKFHWFIETARSYLIISGSSSSSSVIVPFVHVNLCVFILIVTKPKRNDNFYYWKMVIGIVRLCARTTDSWTRLSIGIWYHTLAVFEDPFQPWEICIDILFNVRNSTLLSTAWHRMCIVRHNRSRQKCYNSVCYRLCLSSD